MKCSIGEFLNDGKEFRFKEQTTKYAFSNVLYNDFGFVSEVGQNAMASGTLLLDDKEIAVIVNNNESTIYFRDDDSSIVWCVGGFPYVSEVENFSCTHADGYSIISSVKNEIEVSVKIYVPNNFNGIIYSVNIKNLSNKKRNISVVPASKMLLTGFEAPRFCNIQNQVSYGDFDESVNGYFYNSLNPWQKKHNKYCAVLCTNAIVDSFEGEESEFFGSNSSMSYPYELLCRKSLDSKRALGGFPFAAVMVKQELNPGECVDMDFALALVSDKQEAKNVYSAISSHEKVEDLFSETIEAIKSRHSAVTICTPEKRLDYFVNIWLKRGLEYCLFKKAAVRDNLQFAHGITMTDPIRTKKEIRKVLKYQYNDGHTVRSWNPLDTVYYSDGPLWIVMTVTGYLKYSGDMEFLNEVIPYFDGGSGTVYEHIIKCIDRINSDRGPHNLPLARYADWNDALNLGTEDAESVFMAMAFGYMLLEMTELERYLGHKDLAEKYKIMHEELKNTVNETAWDEDGEYYIRGYIGDKKIGASESDGSVIYVNPQSWSIIGGIVTEERLPKVRTAIDKYLDTDLGCMVNYPAYDRYDMSVGRISAQLPGTVENGAVYCHATGFKAYADGCIYDGDSAVDAILKIMPDSKYNSAKESSALPYAMTSSYNIDEQTRGRAGRPWLTGTQCWAMNTIVEKVLGVERAYGGFMIKPSIPKGWNEASVNIRRFDDEYSIKIMRNGKKTIYVDGKSIDGNMVPFFNDGKHEIIVNI